MKVLFGTKTSVELQKFLAQLSQRQARQILEAIEKAKKHFGFADNAQTGNAQKGIAVEGFSQEETTELLADFYYTVKAILDSTFNTAQEKAEELGKLSNLTTRDLRTHLEAKTAKETAEEIEKLTNLGVRDLRVHLEAKHKLAEVLGVDRAKCAGFGVEGIMDDSIATMIKDIRDEKTKNVAEKALRDIVK
jgi:hypothetical protein